MKPVSPYAPLESTLLAGCILAWAALFLGMLLKLPAFVAAGPTAWAFLLITPAALIAYCVFQATRISKTRRANTTA